MRLLFLSLLSVCLLSSCARHSPTPYELHGERGALRPGANYMIQPGDTLFGIAWRYGLDMEELARWNGISNPDRILAGYYLQTRPPAGIKREKIIVPQVTDNGQPGWRWPTRGKVIRTFSANTPGGQGLKIAGTKRQPVYTAHEGEVAYVGSGVFGFGRMVILQHDNRILSAYGYLADVDVKEGQWVKSGQQIATMGISPQNIPTLHFEIRKQGKSVNPFSFIGTTPRY